MKNNLMLVLWVLLSNLLLAQEFERKVDSIIQTEFKETQGPGGVFLIAHKGKPVYRKAIGKSNLELETDLCPENVFQIGSMTKQFTAISILLLEQQGKLKVTDPISKYIPEYPNGKNITIHQLLTHTSGIKDFTKMKTLSEIAQKEMTTKMVVDFFKNEPVTFQPGEKFDYNNSGYVLLGYLIELTSGKTYENYIQDAIFTPLGMTHSYFASDRKVIPKRAYGYHKKSQGYVNKTSINFSVPAASGALMSTSEDLLKWQNALHQHLLLKAGNAAKAFQKYKLNDGQEIEYGYGWHLKNINGVATREHGGSIFGFKAMGVYFPAEDLYIVGLSNCDCNSPTQITRDIAALALKNLKK